IVDQFIPRGRLILIAGASGSGKSSLLYGLAEAVSNGSDFMGQLTTKRGKVCFIQSDESPENAADKLKVMGVVGEFHLFTDWTSFDEDNLTALQEQQQYDLIVMDSLTTLLGAGRPNGPSMNDAEFGFDLYPLNK
ncbi:AAA family ATPase, partial [Synechococcus sp. AH-736-A19]|nr:AAA family ATPase [Synechococcus sp. AH-736-A19]